MLFVCTYYNCDEAVRTQILRHLVIPAQGGMTKRETFYEFTTIDKLRNDNKKGL